MAVAFGAIAIGAVIRLTPSTKSLDDALQTGQASGFNIVVVSLDTTRADRIGCYGHDGAGTPVLDRLANEGIRFADAVSPVPMTLPAHASMFTGLDPPRHGVRLNGKFRLHEEHVTLAEVLRDQGYDTAAFVSAFVLDARYGLAQGFSLYDAEMSPGRTSTAAGEAQRLGSDTTDRALQWLVKKRGDADPFFLWVHYFDAHEPYSPPAPFAQQFSSQLYDGEIAYADSQLGRLVHALEPWRERTLLFVLGDHGESLGEHGEDTHSDFVYDATQQVPFVLWAPGVVESPVVVDNAMVSISDLFPTVLDLLGINPAGNLDGLSVLLSVQDPDRIVYLETMRPFLESGWAPPRAVRRHRDKLIALPRPEYYDLKRDPHELENLHARAPQDQISLLTAAIALRVAGSSPAPVAAVTPTTDELEHLQALGYLDGGSGSPVDAELATLPDPKDMLVVKQMLREAITLRQQRRFEEARVVCREGLSLSPDNLRLLRQLANINLQSGHVAEAEELLLRCRDLSPEASIFVSLFEIALRTGRPGLAKERLDEAVSLDSEHGSVIISQGDWAASRGRFKEALEHYDRAHRMDPHRTGARARQRIEATKQRMAVGVPR